MAAPASAYTGLSLYIGDCEHRQAILAPDYNTFKLRFYLDEVIGGKEGVVGLVNPSGINANYHNLATRQGKGRIGNYVALNDGGLNTKGKVTAFSMPAEMGNLTGETNDITFLAAYYVSSLSTQYGVKYLEAGSSTWQTVSATVDLAEGETITRKFEIPPLAPNQSVQFKAFIANSEGEFETDVVFVLVWREVIMMSYDDEGTSFGLCAALKDVSIYTDTEEIEIGTFFSTNTVLTAPAPAGGYSDGVNFYTYDISFGVTAIYSCASPPSRLYIDYIAFEGSAFAACSLDGVSGIIYYETVGSVTTWFTSSSPMDSTKAPSGFYAYMDGATRRVVEVGSAGVQISDVSC